MPPANPETTPQNPEEFYLTTPIYYVNARPHIGHAYTTIVADVLARRHRLLGHQTFFLTGTDEHGQKIERSAAAAGVPPQQFADQVSQSFRDLWDRMGLTYDRFLRTTSDPHKQGAQALFAELFRLGHIYLSSYTGSYCVSDEAFVDLPPATPCPDCGRPLETVTEENFFFRLSAFQLPLLDLIESNTLRITPEGSRNEVLSFLRGNLNEVLLRQGSGNKAKIANSETAPGLRTYTDHPSGETHEEQILGFSALGEPYLPGALKDLSISRSSFTWGIPVPQPAASLTRDPQVIYVWLDALANYMTAIGYGNPDPAAQQEFKKWWPANLHLVGKEITRFHCIYWPAFLLALNPATAAPIRPSAEQSPATASPANAPLATASPTTSVILSEAKDPRISSFLQPTHNSEGAPSTAKLHRALGGNVRPSSAPTWATPEAEISPEEHGLPPESPTNAAPFTSSATLKGTASAVPSLSPTEPALAAESGVGPATLTPADHAAWAAHWLPKQITANGWLLFDNSKMSKSKGNVVRTETILDAFGTLCPPKPTTEPAAPLKDTASAVSQNAPSKEAALAAEATNPTPHDRDLFAADVLRYYLLREIPFGQDGSFSFEALVTRYNADLANGYGNLVSRTLTLVKTKLDAKFSQIATTPFKFGLGPTLEYAREEDRFIWEYGKSSYDDPLFKDSPDFEHALSTLLEKNKFSQACELISQAITQVDGYLSEHQPWKLAKSDAPEDRAKLAEVLYTAAESIRILTALLHPILPHATASVWAQLGLSSIEEAATRGDLRNLQWGGLQPGTKLGPLGPIFPRADKSLIQVMTDMENQTTPKPDLTATTYQLDAAHPDTSPFPEAPISSATASTPVTPSALTDDLAPAPTHSTDPAAGPRTSTLPTPNPGATVAGSHAITTERTGTPSHTEAPASGIFAQTSNPTTQSPSQTPDQSPEITIDDFAKIDLRVAQITLAERIPKADKLLRLEVDLGPNLGTRQILSGIAEHYTPESLLGRRIIVIANLAPRKMRGLESHGMLLAASHGENGRPILATTAEDTPLGSRLK